MKGPLAFLALCALVAHVLGGCKSGVPQWTTANGNLIVNGEVFHLKGVNWFGFETGFHAPHGLWGETTVKATIDFFKNNDFNTIRLPFSVEMVLDGGMKPGNINYQMNPELRGMNTFKMYEHVVDKLGEAGILVLIDQHHLKDSITEEPVGQYSKSQVIQSWKKMMNVMNKKWNVMGVDIKNEPHGTASWGTGQAKDWDKFATEMIKVIDQTGFKGLYFVEGIGNGPIDSPWKSYGDAKWWGGCMEGVYNHPISTGAGALDKRVVYAPHVYGPDVHKQAYFSDSSFNNLKAFNKNGIWYRHFGFVEGKTGNPVVLGEWGGKYGAGPTGGLDKSWQDTLSQYLRDHCMADQFYWDYNPNSGDTGGLVKADWKTPETAKLGLLKKTQPHPSKLTKNGGSVCLSVPGAFANAACAKGAPAPSPNDPAPAPQPQPSGGGGGGGGGGGSGCAGLTIIDRSDNKWGNQAGTYEVTVKNTGSSSTSGSFMITGVSIDKSWNYKYLGGGRAKLQWDLAPGKTQKFGFNYKGTPKISC